MLPDQTYRVLRLIVENYKRLKAVDVTPPRNEVIVAGANAQGKSSILDAIAAVLGGKRQMADMPIRQGQDESEIVCVLGDGNEQEHLLVKRIIRPNGKTELEITAPGGFKAPTPQAILDSLYSSIAFDPLEFVQMEPTKQAEALRQLVGLDVSDLEQARQEAYDERTSWNRLAKAKQIEANGIEYPEDTPEEEIDVSDLVDQLRACDRELERINAEKDRAQQATNAVLELTRKVNSIKSTIVDLEARLEIARSSLQDAENQLESAKAVQHAAMATAQALPAPNTEEIRAKIVAATETNRHVAVRKRKMQILREAEEAIAKANECTAKIESIEKAKQERLVAVKWPIAGLELRGNEVYYNGVPLSQASTAEAITVSFAIAAAMNPKLKVVLVRNASVLDESSMARLSDLAKQYDMQAWIEVVESDNPSKIVIEDGMVVAAPPAQDVPVKQRRKRRVRHEQEADQGQGANVS